MNDSIIVLLILLIIVQMTPRVVSYRMAWAR